ncbi:hypothetical protein GCM10027053_51950 [Intrasporangium mesophilum]
MTEKKQPAPKRVLRVIAQLVPVKGVDGKVFYLQAGDVITDRVSQESVEHLDGLGFLAAD